MRYLLLFTAVLSFLLNEACYTTRTNYGGGEKTASRQRKYTVADIALPEGYSIELVASGLTFPTGITFDENGRAYIVESGYSYGEVFTTPRLLQLDKQEHKVIAEGGKNGPWNGVSYYKGNFYVEEGGELEGGKILEISRDGKIKALVSNLPSTGDHHTNGPVISKEGYIYFGQGAATNSGVVGKDNYEFGWLKRHPDFHDVPCKEIVLAGENFESENVLTEDKNDKTATGAYSSFGNKTEKNQVVPGKVPCNGAVMKLPVNGGKPELVAWGFRNPYGLAFSREGKLFVTDNGYDDRGSRPVWGAGDILWEVSNGMWYGWPDYSGNMPLIKDDFRAPGKPSLKFVLAEHPNSPPPPTAILGVHSSSNGLDISSNTNFGYVGQAFIAQFGDMSPTVGKVLAPVGFKVVNVDLKTGVIQDFAVNTGKKKGPASLVKKGGLERPIAVRFSPDGSALYVVDFGIVRMSKDGALSEKGTGAVWRITKKGAVK